MKRAMVGPFSSAPHDRSTVRRFGVTIWRRGCIGLRWWLCETACPTTNPSEAGGEPSPSGITLTSIRWHGCAVRADDNPVVVAHIGGVPQRSPNDAIHRNMGRFAALQSPPVRVSGMKYAASIFR